MDTAINPVVALTAAIQSQPWALSYAAQDDAELAAEYAERTIDLIVNPSGNAVIRNWRDLTVFAPTPDTISKDAYRGLQGLHASVKANRDRAKPGPIDDLFMLRFSRLVLAMGGAPVTLMASTPSSSGSFPALFGTMCAGVAVSLFASWVTSNLDRDPNGTEVTPGWVWNNFTHVPLAISTGLFAGAAFSGSNAASNAAETIGLAFLVGTIAAFGYFKYCADKRTRKCDAFAAVADNFLHNLPTTVSAEQLRKHFEANPSRVYSSGYAKQSLHLQDQSLLSWITTLDIFRKKLTALKTAKTGSTPAPEWLDAAAVDLITKADWIDPIQSKITIFEEQLAILRLRISQMQNHLSQGVAPDQTNAVSTDILKLTSQCDAVMAELDLLATMLSKVGIVKN